MASLSKDIGLAIKNLAIGIVATVLFLPLSVITPKIRNRIVVVSRHNGLFIDNAKHFFLYLCKHASPKPDVIFLTHNATTCTELLGNNLPACRFPELKSIRYLLTANLIIVDSAEWIAQGKYQLAFRSNIVQLWHGAPLKQIELPLFLDRISNYPRPLQWIAKLYKKAVGRHAMNDVVLSTSTYFTEKAFRPAFNSRYFSETGYPRNDILLSNTVPNSIDPDYLINTDSNVMGKISQAKSNGLTTFLYSPTFRKELSTSISPSDLDLSRINQFCMEHGFIFSMKLHPVLADNYLVNDFSNIVNISAISDVYPLFGQFDVLITDYSSIYFDFLLLDRPIIFYPYDLKQYIESDRSLLFEYQDIAPGHICVDQSQLENAMLNINPEEHSKERQEIKTMVFDHCDSNASERLWDVLKKRHIN